MRFYIKFKIDYEFFELSYKADTVEEALIIFHKDTFRNKNNIKIYSILNKEGKDYIDNFEKMIENNANKMYRRKRITRKGNVITYIC